MLLGRGISWDYVVLQVGGRMRCAYLRDRVDAAGGSEFGGVEGEGFDVGKEDGVVWFARICEGRE